jgi:hypothetical protein
VIYGEPDGLIHVTGVAIQWSGEFRQRCVWCGALLISAPVTEMVEAGLAAMMPGFLVSKQGQGRLLGHGQAVEGLGIEGPMACVRLDHAATR